MKNEVNRLKEELNNKDKFTNKLSIEFSTKETEYTHKIEDLHTKIKDETTSYLNLLNKFEILEKEFSELVINSFFIIFYYFLFLISHLE